MSIWLLAILARLFEPYWTLLIERSKRARHRADPFSPIRFRAFLSRRFRRRHARMWRRWDGGYGRIA